jgi:hypothetical protein
MTVVTVNRKGGGISVLEDTHDKWYLHPDESVDVAVMAINLAGDLLSSDLDVRAVPLAMFLDKGGMEELRIGIGDEVYMPGLFTHIASAHRNAPILRHGNVAMIPDGPIQVDAGFAEVYLVEARSIGGMSGSPVFVRNTVSFRNPNGQILHGVSGETRLLGLIHGHWDIKESEMNQQRFTHDPRRGVNLGIAVVVPAAKILETINHPELVRMRIEIDEAWKRAISPGLD